MEQLHFMNDVRKSCDCESTWRQPSKLWVIPCQGKYGQETGFHKSKKAKVVSKETHLIGDAV